MAVGSTAAAVTAALEIRENYKEGKTGIGTIQVEQSKITSMHTSKLAPLPVLASRRKLVLSTYPYPFSFSAINSFSLLPILLEVPVSHEAKEETHDGVDGPGVQPPVVEGEEHRLLRQLIVRQRVVRREPVN